MRSDKTPLETSTDDPTEALRTVQAAWNAAGRHWDAAMLTAIYTDDAFFYGGRPGHSVGAASILAYFVSYRGIIESATMDLVDQHVVALAPGCVMAQGYVDFGFVLAGRGATRSRLRTTLTLVATREGWRIRQHHFSPTPAEPPLA
jgi:uncharacterized protein (TIGR02246 family)